MSSSRGKHHHRLASEYQETVPTVTAPGFLIDRSWAPSGFGLIIGLDKDFHGHLCGGGKVFLSRVEVDELIGTLIDWTDAHDFANDPPAMPEEQPLQLRGARKPVARESAA